MRRIKIIRNLCAAIAVLTSVWSGSAASSRLQMNGIASRVEFSEVIFYGALYTEERHSDSRRLLLSAEDKAIEIRISGNAYYPRRWQRHWMESIAINAGQAEIAKHAETVASFLNLIEWKMTEGDTIRIERSGRIVTTSFNGTVLAEFDDPYFIDLLLRVWIGPVPLSRDFKESILANGKPDAARLMSYSALSPSAQRIAETQRLLAAAGTEAATPESAAMSKANTQVEAVAGHEESTLQRDSLEAEEAEDREVSATPAATANPLPRQHTQHEKVSEMATNEDYVIASLKEEIIANTTSAISESFKVDRGAHPELAKLENVAIDPMPIEQGLLVKMDAAGLISHQRYVSDLITRTGKFAEYPKKALKRGKQGTVRVSVTIDKAGTIQTTRIVEGADHDELNDAAMEAIKAADPYPPIPDEIGGDQYTFTVPIVFNIQASR